MYRVINAHTEQVLDAIRPDQDVRPYIWLKQQFRKIDVSADKAFQKQFRRYWQLNAARLGDRFVQTYFSLLESLKDDDQIAVEDVARKLYKTPTRADGRQSLQFSFSTKLIHTLRPNSPVYDSNVEAFYFLPTKSLSESLEKKLQRLLLAYNFLVFEYERVLRHDLLRQAINAFRDRYDKRAECTDEKVVDTLIWRFVTLLRSGAIRDRGVAYG
jgi:hypothetical protein